MQLLAERPVTVPMYFVRPHVKPGDYYLMINPINGRRMWVYPRHIGERNYAVTSALGTDDASSWAQWLNPQTLAQEVQETRAALNEAQMYTKLAIGASIVASALMIYSFMRD